MNIAITPVYAALIAVLMVTLSVLTGLKRGQIGVALGDGGDPGLALAMRRFGNLSEYAAVALLLLLLMEMKGVAAPYLHAYGAALVALRLIHPVALFADGGAPAWKKKGRIVSAAGTALLIFIGAAALLIW